MAISINGTTGITFPDSTVQSTAYGVGVNRPYFKAIYNHSNFIYPWSAVDAAHTKTPLNQVVYDSVNGFDTTNTEYTVKVAGTYAISGTITFSTTGFLAATVVSLGINGVVTADRVQTNAYGNFGSDVNTVGGQFDIATYTFDTIVNLKVNDKISLLYYIDYYGAGSYPGYVINASLSGYMVNYTNLSDALNYTYLSGTQNWTVPNYSSTLSWEMVGSGGGGGGSDLIVGTSGYPGAKLTGTLNLTPGSVVQIKAGLGGNPGVYYGSSYMSDGMPLVGRGAGTGGSGSIFFDGGNGGINGSTSGSGGGGGSGTALYVNGVLYAVAGGGGGGGGAGQTANPGQQTVASTGSSTGGAGQTHPGDGGGGGGGGGGYLGAAGGSYISGDTTAYAGGTGSNLVPSGWTASTATNGGAGQTAYHPAGSRAYPGGTGYVKITWT